MRLGLEHFKVVKEKRIHPLPLSLMDCHGSVDCQDIQISNQVVSLA